MEKSIKDVHNECSSVAKIKVSGSEKRIWIYDIPIIQLAQEIAHLQDTENLVFGRSPKFRTFITIQRRIEPKVNRAFFNDLYFYAPKSHLNLIFVFSTLVA